MLLCIGRIGILVWAILSSQYGWAQDFKAEYLNQYRDEIQRHTPHPLVGYKAGLTSKPIQKKFSTHQPISGLLFLDNQYQLNSGFSLSQHENVFLEMEIGFVAKQTVTPNTIKTIPLEQQFYPVAIIELPIVDPKNSSIKDIIIDNVGVNRFILGPKLPENWDVNDLKMCLSHNDKVYLIGNSDEPFNDQWKALSWLVKHILTQGWQIQQGHVLLTGAIGGMKRAQIGEYQYRINDQDILRFYIHP